MSRLLWPSLCALVLGPVLAGYILAQQTPSEPVFTPLSTTVPSGVRVLFEQDNTTFPKHWEGMHAEALEAGPRAKAKGVLETALKKYPAEVLERDLKRIYIFNKISYQGLPYGGTYDHTTGTVYLLDVPWAPGFVEESFHHELSSVLLIKHPPKYFTGRWSVLSDYSKFMYDNGGIDALKNGKASTRYDRKMMEKGFLNEYSQASPEEDFNCVSEGLFCGGKRFWSFVDEYPKVKEKVQMAIKFYGSLDKRFTEEYFRKLPAPAAGSTR
jgi:hypothetical protein